MSVTTAEEITPLPTHEPLPIDTSRGTSSMKLFIATEASLFLILFASYWYMGKGEFRWPPDNPQNCITRFQCWFCCYSAAPSFTGAKLKLKTTSRCRACRPGDNSVDGTGFHCLVRTRISGTTENTEPSLRRLRLHLLHNHDVPQRSPYTRIIDAVVCPVSSNDRTARTNPASALSQCRSLLAFRRPCLGVRRCHSLRCSKYPVMNATAHPIDRPAVSPTRLSSICGRSGRIFYRWPRKLGHLMANLFHREWPPWRFVIGRNPHFVGCHYFESSRAVTGRRGSVISKLEDSRGAR